MTDAAGRALPDLEVALVASHRAFEIRKLGRVERGRTRRTTTTDKNGDYSLRWYWNSYFNHFDLVIGMTVRVPEGERFYTLERRALTEQMGGQGPLTVDVAVADTSFLQRYRNFVASLDSDDEREVYDRMGIPAKIDRLSLATHDEVTWWYFEAGKAYRFRGGALIEVSEFEPVEPFDDESERRQ